MKQQPTYKVQYTHVTTECIRYELELNLDHLTYVKNLEHDINNPEHNDRIVRALIDYDYDYDWSEVSHDVVDGYYQDMELIKQVNPYQQIMDNADENDLKRAFQLLDTLTNDSEQLLGDDASAIIMDAMNLISNTTHKG